MWLRTVGVEGCRGSVGKDSVTDRKVAVTVAVVDNHSSCRRRHRPKKQRNTWTSNVQDFGKEISGCSLRYGCFEFKSKRFKIMIAHDHWKSRPNAIHWSNFIFFNFDMPDLLIVISWSLKYCLNILRRH